MTRSMEDTKSQLLEIAYKAQPRIDNFPEVRKQLDPLFEDLEKYNRYKPEEILELKTGLWKQIWTDDSDDVKANGRIIATDRTRTYQFVYEDGTFYNFNEILLPLKLKLSAYLSSYYKVDGKGIRIGFDGLFLRWGGLGDEASMKNMIDTLKGGQLKKTWDVSRVSRSPNGPVNATGFNETIYIDDDLRLDRAYNDADQVIDLYVMRRVV